MKRIVFRTILLGASLWFHVTAVFASCAPNAYRQVAAEWEVPADVLYAISLTELGRFSETWGYHVWPWALNINAQSYYPSSEDEALKLIEQAIAGGSDRIAIGLMQIYWAFHHQTFRGNPVYALDVASNIRAGAKILRDFMDSTPDIWTAVGYYYAGPSASDRSRRLAASYTDRVRSVYLRHVIGRCHGQ